MTKDKRGVTRVFVDFHDYFPRESLIIKAIETKQAKKRVHSACWNGEPVFEKGMQEHGTPRIAK